jgi:hypothetical protein
MAWRIEIDFELPAGGRDRNGLVHRIRNFGEDLYRMFAKSGEARIDIGEVDRAADRLVVDSVKTRQLRTVSAEIEKMLEQHNLTSVAHLSKGKTL